MSLAALAVAGFGALRIRTVLAAEEFKRPEALHRIYADVNRQAFAGALPDVRTDWAVLKSPEASGETLFDGNGFTVLLDPILRRTVRTPTRTARHSRLARRGYKSLVKSDEKGEPHEHRNRVHVSREQNLRQHSGP